MSRLTVVMASRKLVRIWKENLLFQLFSVPSRKREEIKTLCSRQGAEKIFTKSLFGKLTRPSEEREWLSENCKKLKQMSRRGIGRGEILTSLFRSSIKNLNLSDFNCTRQVDGQIRLRENQLFWRIGIEK